MPSSSRLARRRYFGSRFGSGSRRIQEKNENGPVSSSRGAVALAGSGFAAGAADCA